MTTSKTTVFRSHCAIIFMRTPALVEKRIYGRTTTSKRPTNQLTGDRQDEKHSAGWRPCLRRGQAPYSISTTMFAFFDGA